MVDLSTVGARLKMIELGVTVGVLNIGATHCFTKGATHRFMCCYLSHSGQNDVVLLE